MRSETWECIQRDQRALLVETHEQRLGAWQESPGGLGTSAVAIFRERVLPHHAEPFT